MSGLIEMVANLKTSVRELIELLVSQKYEEIERITRGIRLDAESIDRAITEYGRTLVIPPDTVFENLDVVAVNNSQPAQWSIWMNLWTVEEGKSDLSVQMTLIQQRGGYSIELDGIHVL
jgi:hypothetical protein